MELPMQQQTRWEQPPEMLPASRGSCEPQSETEADPESQELLADPSPRPRGLGARLRAVALPALTLAALGCVAALLSKSSAPVGVGGLGPVGLAQASSAAVATEALEGQAFIYVTPADVAARFQSGSMLVIQQAGRTEYHLVERSHAETGAVRLFHGLDGDFDEGAEVSVATATPEAERALTVREAGRLQRFSAPLSSDARGEEDSDSPDTKVRLNRGCFQFKAGDQIEISSAVGHYELNMVTGVTPDEVGPEGECDLHLAYPVKHDHHAAASEVSKVIDASGAGLNPTPAPATDAPMLVTDAQAADATSAPATTATPTPAPTEEPSTSQPVEDDSAKERGLPEGEAGGQSASLVVGGALLGLVLPGALLALLCSRALHNNIKLGGASRDWARSPPDAIVVPGGGVGRDGALAPWVEERLRRAFQIYQEAKEADCGERARVAPHIVTMCEGVRYSKRDRRGDRILMLESQLAAEFLRSLGADPADIISDNLSLDTKGNAYFLRTTHTDVVHARSFVVVTSGFHMARAKATFEKIFRLGPFPEGGSDYTLRFEEVQDSMQDSSIEPTALKRRVEWESSQLQSFRNISKQWRDLHDVHSYIFAGELANDSPPDQGAGKMPHSFTAMNAHWTQITRLS